MAPNNYLVLVQLPSLAAGQLESSEITAQVKDIFGIITPREGNYHTVHGNVIVLHWPVSQSKQVVESIAAFKEKGFTTGLLATIAGSVESKEAKELITAALGLAKDSGWHVNEGNRLFKPEKAQDIQLPASTDRFIRVSSL